MASNPESGVLSYPNEILHLPMFYPYISREEADALLMRRNLGMGTFLIRPSGNLDPSVLSISLSGACNDVFRVRVFIERDARGSLVYFITSSMRFSMFSHLLEHYKHNQILDRQQVINLYLLHPLVIPTENIPYVLAEIRGDIDSSCFQGTGVGIVNYPSVPDGLHQRHHSQAGTAVSSESKTKVATNQIRANNKGRNAMTGVHSVTSALLQVHSSFASPPLPGKTGNKESKNKSPLPSKRRTQSLSDPNQTSLLPSQGEDRRKTICYSKNIPSGRRSSFIKCRPPVPLPRASEPDEGTIVYSQVNENKQYFEELYQRLKEEEETCECGLRIEDSELPDGWMVHLSDDEATKGMIFYQRGDETTWNFPQQILPKIDQHQMQFILYLCQKANQPPPHSLVLRLNESTSPSTRQRQEKKYLHVIPDLLHENSASSTTSSSLSSSSSSSLKSGAKLASEHNLSFSTSHIPLTNLLQQPLPQEKQQQQLQQQEHPSLIKQASISSLSSSSSTTPSDAAFYEIPATLFNSLTLNNNTALNLPQDQLVPCVGTYSISESGEIEIRPYDNIKNVAVPPPVSSLLPIIQSHLVNHQQIHPQSTSVINDGSTIGGTTVIANDSSGSGGSYSRSGGSYSGSGGSYSRSGGSYSGSGGSYSGSGDVSSGRTIVGYEDVQQLEAVLRRPKILIQEQQLQQHIHQQQHQQSPSHYVVYDPKIQLKGNEDQPQNPNSYDHSNKQQQQQQQQRPLHQNIQNIQQQHQLQNQQLLQHQHLQQLKVQQQILQLQLQEISQQLSNQQPLQQSSQYPQLEQQIPKQQLPQLQNPQLQQQILHQRLQQFPQEEHQQIILQNGPVLQLQPSQSQIKLEELQEQVPYEHLQQSSQYPQLQQQLPQLQNPQLQQQILPQRLQQFPQQEHQQIILQNGPVLQLQPSQSQIKQEQLQEQVPYEHLQQIQQDELLQRMHLLQLHHQNGQQQTQPPSHHHQDQ